MGKETMKIVKRFLDKAIAFKGEKEESLWVAIPLGLKKKTIFEKKNGAFVYVLKPQTKKSDSSILFGSSKKAKWDITGFKIAQKVNSVGYPDFLMDLEDFARLTGYTKYQLLKFTTWKPPLPYYIFDNKMWFILSEFLHWYSQQKAASPHFRGPKWGHKYIKETQPTV